jgi:hypothetical protein
MNGRKTLIAATLGEVTLLVGVLAGYLIAIAARLRSVSSTLGSVTFGVRAIETQTEPIGPRLREINGALEQVAAALRDVVGEEPGGQTGSAAESEDPTGTIDAPDDLPRPTT